MPTGTVYKYNKRRKFSVIRPNHWTTGLVDVLFETKDFETKLGEKVEYESETINGKKYALNIKRST